MTILTLGVSYLLPDAACAGVDNIVAQIKNFHSYIKRGNYINVEIIYSLQSGSFDTYINVRSKILAYASNIPVSLYYAGIQGVAISRNTVITSSKGDYIWFLDIDCRLAESIDSFLDYISLYREPLLYLSTVNIIRANISKVLGDMPPTIYRVSIYSLPDILRIVANAATYNIVTSSKFLADNPYLRFDPKLGLGTYYHQSDEALFLIYFFKAMLKARVASFHSYSLASLVAESKSHLASGRALIASLESKGYVLAKSHSSFFITLPFLPFLSILFAFKFRKILGLTLSIKSVVKGYFVGASSL